MGIRVDVDTAKLDGIQEYFANFPTLAKTAMANAINDTAGGFALMTAKKAIYSETAFPAGYLDLPERLWVSKAAYPEQLVATITARDRPTLLSRFALPGQPIGNGRGTPSGVSVEVNPGEVRSIPDAFLMRVANGNVVVAIKLKPGQMIRGYTGARLSQKEFRPGSGIFILEAPSVDQVFRDVALDIAEPIAQALAREFLRRFNAAVNP